LIILNGVTFANSLNYLWYVCVFDKYLWITGLLIFLSLFWIILELRYSLSCFEYYTRSNILNTERSRLWENKFSSTERSVLGDHFCRSLFVLYPLDILFSVRLRFMDSDYLFDIFKLVLHIKSKELLAEAYAALAKFDTTLTSHLGFTDPKYYFFLLLTWSVPSEGYCRNAYMMWGFGVIVRFFWYRKNCWPSQFTFFFSLLPFTYIRWIKKIILNIHNHAL
jgi:hypothetical protein